MPKGQLFCLSFYALICKFSTIRTKYNTKQRTPYCYFILLTTTNCLQLCCIQVNFRRSLHVLIMVVVIIMDIFTMMQLTFLLVSIIFCRKTNMHVLILGFTKNFVTFRYLLVFKFFLFRHSNRLFSFNVLKI